MSNTLTTLPIDSIVEGENALRPAQRESEQYLGLVESIRERGFQGTITVNKTKDANGEVVYKLVDGCQRLNAARDAGLTEIPVSLRSDVSDEDVLLEQSALNHHSVNTKPVEYQRALKNILKLNPTLTIAELAKKLGATTIFIEQRLSLGALDEGVAKLVDDGQIKLGNALALAKLPVEDQKEFAAAAISSDVGSFTSAVGERVKEIREAKKAGGEVKPAGFQPVAKIRQRAEIEAAIANPAAINALVKTLGDGSVEGAVKVVLEWAINMDAASLEAREKEYNEQQAKIKAAREEAAAKRKAAKEAEAAEAAATV